MILGSLKCDVCNCVMHVGPDGDLRAADYGRRWVDADPQFSAGAVALTCPQVGFEVKSCERTLAVCHQCAIDFYYSALVRLFDAAEVEAVSMRALDAQANGELDEIDCLADAWQVRDFSLAGDAGPDAAVVGDRVCVDQVQRASEALQAIENLFFTHVHLKPKGAERDWLTRVYQDIQRAGNLIRGVES